MSLIAMSDKPKDTRIKADIAQETAPKLAALAKTKDWSIQKTAGKLLDLCVKKGIKP